ncbi:MAG TPA: calcium-binding protein, partial [Geodermatophilus sp.]|nr:calcium-binding protein [Geodermatophilus sp.]
MRRRIASGALLLALAGGPVSGVLADDAAEAAIDSAPPNSALAALDAVEVKGRAPRTGYDRYRFGDGWVDTDRNGCDTRNDVLARDLTGETFRPGTDDCVVLSGTLEDSYSGRTIE